MVNVTFGFHLTVSFEGKRKRDRKSKGGMRVLEADFGQRSRFVFSPLAIARGLLAPAQL